MKTFIFSVSLLAVVMAGNVRAQANGVYADVNTTVGNFTIQLDYINVPRTVANFIRLAEGSCCWVDYATGLVKKEPYYEGVTFHRVISGFMNQTGSRKGDGTDGPGYKFQDEFTGGSHTGSYVVSMANSGPNTNGAQFFITLSTQSGLNNVHSVFGSVILYDAPDDGTTDTSVGQQVCSAINGVSTDGNDKPLVDVVINSITIRRVGALAVNFDEHAQGLPVVEAPQVTIDHGGSQVGLLLGQSTSSRTIYSYSTDLITWQEGAVSYRDHDDSALTEIDVSSLANGQDKLFFNASQVNYDVTEVLWPRLLTGKTLSIVTRFGMTAFTFTSETGGTLIHGGTTPGSFAATRGADDWLGTRMYIETNLVAGTNPVHFRLRFGQDQLLPAYFSGRHSGTIIFFGSGSDELTSGNMTLTR